MRGAVERLEKRVPRVCGRVEVFRCAVEKKGSNRKALSMCVAV